MLVLTILVLLGAAVTYGLFFLLFKLIWILLKKQSNKWPLILSGIFTGITWAAIIITVYLLVSMAIAPFKTIIDDISQHPDPVYGERVYHDPVYPITVNVFDGMQFSDWIHLDKTAVKIGIDTNFIKEKSGKKPPLTLSLLVRNTTPNKGEQAFFAEADKILAQGQQQRRLQLSQRQQLTLGGKPAYFVKGTLATNSGMADMAGVALYNNSQEIYAAAAFNIGAPASTDKLENTVKSLRLNN